MHRIFLQADPAKLMLAFFASHMVTSLGFLNRRFAIRTFSIITRTLLDFKGVISALDSIA